jgi:hypothetical protein
MDQLEDIERRLTRLERVVYQTYTDVQRLADYAYTNVRTEVTADEIQRLEGFNKLQDMEAFKVGLMFHEVAALKHTVRHLRRQARQDALTLIRDLMRPRSHSERQRSSEGSPTGADSVPGMFDGIPSPEGVAR